MSTKRIQAGERLATSTALERLVSSMNLDMPLQILRFVNKNKVLILLDIISKWVRSKI